MAAAPGTGGGALPPNAKPDAAGCVAPPPLKGKTVATGVAGRSEAAPPWPKGGVAAAARPKPNGELTGGDPAPALPVRAAPKPAEGVKAPPNAGEVDGGDPPPPLAPSNGRPAAAAPANGLTAPAPPAPPKGVPAEKAGCCEKPNTVGAPCAPPAGAPDAGGEPEAKGSVLPGRAGTPKPPDPNIAAQEAPLASTCSSHQTPLHAATRVAAALWVAVPSGHGVPVAQMGLAKAPPDATQAQPLFAPRLPRSRVKHAHGSAETTGEREQPRVRHASLCVQRRKVEQRHPESASSSVSSVSFAPHPGLRARSWGARVHQRGRCAVC